MECLHVNTLIIFIDTSNCKIIAKYGYIHLHLEGVASQTNYFRSSDDATGCSSHYFISSCDSTVIGFKQDELCFSELFCYQTSSESCNTATVSEKFHNFNKTEGF